MIQCFCFVDVAAMKKVVREEPETLVLHLLLSMKKTQESFVNFVTCWMKTNKKSQRGWTQCVIPLVVVVVVVVVVVAAEVVEVDPTLVVVIIVLVVAEAIAEETMATTAIVGMEMAMVETITTVVVEEAMVVVVALQVTMAEEVDMVEVAVILAVLGNETVSTNDDLLPFPCFCGVWKLCLAFDYLSLCCWIF
jgi:hypothetical protein